MSHQPDNIFAGTDGAQGTDAPHLSDETRAALNELLIRVRSQSVRKPSS